MSLSPTWAALDDALDLDGPAREAFLAALDARTRAALEPLLRDALCSDSVLDRPDHLLVVLRDDPEDDLTEHDGAGGGSEAHVGERIGPYRTEALVGEGGMGRVFRAHRVDGTFDQTVAVKLVRTALTMAGSDVADRLRRERDVLAALDHPGIARLLDGGETEDGVPYLVTEFVDGAPLTDWADERGLGVAARVRLLEDVARAVSHAHRRFVVHRDLKPSNVLVTERDGTPRPVVLDFGIAKLLAEGEGASGPALTQTGQRVLTPAYAAPELFDPAEPVTVAVDVYGLGALLYELLAGCRPHEDTGTSGTAPSAARTLEPTRPSRAALTATPDAQHRARRLRGDLDTICLKALHVDPARRYASADDFADDLERYLKGRPVKARPDSVGYVVGRFVRRNRGVVVAAAVAALALVGGFGVSLGSLANERSARAQAEAETQRSEAAAARASEAAELLAGVFEGADVETHGRVLTAREALDRGLERVRYVEDDALRGYLMTVLGRTYWTASELALGDSLLREGVALLDRAGADYASRAQAHYYLGRVQGFAGDFAGALEHIGYAYRLASRFLGDENRLTLDAARDLSWVNQQLGQMDEALQLAQQAVQLAEGHDDNARAVALYELGGTYSLLGRHRESIAALSRCVALVEGTEGPASPGAAIMRLRLSQALVEAGRTREALTHQRRVLESFRRSVGPRSLRTVEAMHALGLTLSLEEQHREAAAYLDSARVAARQFELNEGTLLVQIGTDLAAAHNGQGDFGAAEQAAREALRAAAEGGVPPEDPAWPRAWAQLGRALQGQGRTREARTPLQRALQAYEAAAEEPRARAEAEAVRELLAQAPGGP